MEVTPHVARPSITALFFCPMTFLSELETSLQGCPKGSLSERTRFRLEPWWDSLAALIILATFQSSYGKQLRPEDLRACETLGEVMALAR